MYQLEEYRPAQRVKTQPFTAFSTFNELRVSSVARATRVATFPFAHNSNYGAGLAERFTAL